MRLIKSTCGKFYTHASFKLSHVVRFYQFSWHTHLWFWFPHAEFISRMRFWKNTCAFKITHAKYWFRKHESRSVRCNILRMWKIIFACGFQKSHVKLSYLVLVRWNLCIIIFNMCIFFSACGIWTTHAKYWIRKHETRIAHVILSACGKYFPHVFFKNHMWNWIIFVLVRWNFYWRLNKEIFMYLHVYFIFRMRNLNNACEILNSKTWKPPNPPCLKY